MWEGFRFTYIIIMLMFSLRKHAYSNISNILQPKKKKKKKKKKKEIFT